MAGIPAGEAVQRAAAARAAVLRWLYEQEQAGVTMPAVAGVLDTDYATFAGGQLTDSDIDRAARYLSDKGLIEGSRTAGSDGPVDASLTSDGRDCFEKHGGKVADCLNEQSGHATHDYHINTIHNVGAIAIGGGDAYQQTTDLAAVAAFTQGLLNQLGTLPMNQDQRAATQAAADELRSELERPEPESKRISSALSRLVNCIIDAGKPAITALLLALARHYGLPSS
jgi:hypothetical protein